MKLTDIEWLSNTIQAWIKPSDQKSNGNDTEISEFLRNFPAIRYSFEVFGDKSVLFAAKLSSKWQNYFKTIQLRHIHFECIRLCMLRSITSVNPNGVVWIPADGSNCALYIDRNHFRRQFGGFVQQTTSRIHNFRATFYRLWGKHCDAFTANIFIYIYVFFF